MKYLFSLLFTVLSCFSIVLGQDTSSTDIDASKPTNFYSMLDNTIEYTSRPRSNLMGYRGKLLYAPSEAHLILAEVPLLYNDKSNQFGVGDLRARYFWLPYKNYDKFFGAAGPSVDVFVPTGSFNYGIGSGRWLISPGLTIGLMAAEKIQFFPILSYQYASKPVYDNPIPSDNREIHGITFQIITPIVFSDEFFIQLTPIFKFNDLNDIRQDRYTQEIFAAYAITDKMQITAFYNGNFKDNIHQLSAGLTIFLVE